MRRMNSENDLPKDREVEEGMSEDIKGEGEGEGEGKEKARSKVHMSRKWKLEEAFKE